jgi:hypothetical protein
MYNKSMMSLANMMAAMTGGQTESMEAKIERSIFGGAPAEVKNYLIRNKRTVEQEYQLVQEKKSALSKNQREYVEYLYRVIESQKEGGEE